MLTNRQYLITFARKRAEFWTAINPLVAAQWLATARDLEALDAEEGR